MKRFHIALAVRELAASIDDYTQRLGLEPAVVVAGQYAMWRTDALNFSINEQPDNAGQMRHLGFEDDQVSGFTSELDVNGIEWECFSPKAQDDKIVQMYGESVV